MIPDPHRIADVTQRAIELLRSDGDKALKVSRDWQTPLRSSSGPGPRNAVSDPTGTAAAQVADGDDDGLASLNNELRAAMNNLYTDAGKVTDLILKATTAARIELHRAGIGTCEWCPTYCDGSAPHKRLKQGSCPACYAKDQRAKQRAG